MSPLLLVFGVLRDLLVCARSRCQVVASGPGWVSADEDCFGCFLASRRARFWCLVGLRGDFSTSQGDSNFIC
uniref:Putative secreted protein n=1 Tax=Ixodes scapularis TaxID=6945 RepID=A0A4D5RB94_IXOSC